MRPSIRTLVILFGLAMLAVIVRSSQAAIELLLVAGILYPIVKRIEVLHFLEAQSRLYVVGMFLLLGLLLGGHLRGRPEQTFPFAVWWMYGSESRTETLEWYTIEASTAGHEVVEVNPSHLFPSLDRGTFRLPNHFRDLIREGESSRETVAKMLHAFASVYQRETGIELKEMRVIQHQRHFSSSMTSSELLMSEAIH